MFRFSFPTLTRTLLPLAITVILACPAWSQDVFVVSDLSPRTTEKQVRDLFKPYGQVLSVKFKPSRKKGRSTKGQKQTAQVIVKGRKNARRTVKRLNRRSLNGSTILVSISREPDRQDISREPDRQDISRDPDRQDISRDPDRQD